MLFKKIFLFFSLFGFSLVMAETSSLSLAPGSWRVINDGVMGGVSSSEMISTDDGLCFQGFLSLENNGGFASVRRLLDFNLQEASGVRLRVRGDGRTYQLRLRQDESFDNVAWRAEFSTNGEWQTIELPFENFKPVWRGRPVEKAGPVVPAKVRQIGFLLADGQQASFKLYIGAIEFLGRN